MKFIELVEKRVYAEISGDSEEMSSTFQDLLRHD
jgi:hypothetical protein